MPVLPDNNVYRFRDFNFKNLISGISTKAIGDLRRNSPYFEKNIDWFCNHLGINSDSIIRAEQVHSNKVKIVRPKDRGKIVKGVDGLLTVRKGLFLLVITADCFPILFYDSKKHIVGILHAGWEGTSGKIVKMMISRFKSLGSQTEDINIAMGPGICAKHYEVQPDVVKRFHDEKPKLPFFKKGTKYFLDLRFANYQHLINVGVERSNIEMTPVCTFESKDFYSSRKDKPYLTGEFGTLIGML